MEVVQIGLKDEIYPRLLKEIVNPPQKLYLIGNQKILNRNMLAIVGSRECSNYGKMVAKQLAYQLSQQGWIIVSGLAKGIDAYSHIGAIQARKPTIAVLGCGVKTIYPKENIGIYQKILQTGGTILSEYQLEEKPLKQHFPARNRIISGMSMGVIVVEAKRRSGTGITVDFALEQGREVFAVPGNITSSYSEGTNQLIQEGAKAVTKLEDILEELTKLRIP